MAVIRLSPNTYLSTDDGVIITPNQAARLVKQTVLRQKNLTVDTTFNHVVGCDKTRIDFKLKDLNKNAPSQKGFLVEAYLKASDGTLQRLYQSPVIDPASLEPIDASLLQYLDLELDPYADK